MGDAPGQPPAEQPRGRHDRGHQDQRALLERPQQVLGVTELLRHLDRAPPAAERDGRDAVDVAADVDVLVLGHLPGVGGARHRAVGGDHRQPGGAAVHDRPVRAEHLHVRAGRTHDVVPGLGRGEVLRRHPLVAHLVPQVLHDLVEHRLLVDPDQPGGRRVGQHADEDGDGGRHRREGHREGGAQRHQLRPRPGQERGQQPAQHRSLTAHPRGPQSSRST
ncbi:hypothetical protein QFZ66_003787 [Streptomyces sp. B4I13]|nr:hypothetical protein [Streptomyces sp. B4I13]